ncbi:hypothetical protein BTVI_148909 [Pitangus sulphuratus]|nr:hypothetical protein BTVI_148909 [Pitangus sulphuratus]
MFNLFIYDLDEGSDDSSASSRMTKSWKELVKTPECCAALHKDLERRWAEDGDMGREEPSEVQQEQMEGPVPGKNNPVYQYMLEDDLLENNSVEQDLRVLVDNRLVSSRASSVPLWQSRPREFWDVLRRALPTGEELILCLYLAPVKPHPECCIQALQDKRDIDLLKQIQQRATNTIRALEHVSYKDSSGWRRENREDTPSISISI